jgi:hypothetical protein
VERVAPQLLRMSNTLHLGRAKDKEWRVEQAVRRPEGGKATTLYICGGLTSGVNNDDIAVPACTLLVDFIWLYVCVWGGRGPLSMAAVVCVCLWGCCVQRSGARFTCDTHF